uniref:Uncharacterized protein n=1 Tax=Neogobius melanostomus TaxID=47308 RepID=A0A8C6T4X8_9GOBI
MEQAIKTPRTAGTARPVTSSSGRFIRLGTASMMTSPDGPFINLSRLNMTKYSQKPNLSRTLFEYIFHHENDIRNIPTSILQR